MDELRFLFIGSQLRRIHADIAVEESSRVLVFRDHISERPPCYILEVKVVAARFFHELSLKADPTAEILLETDNHAVREHIYEECIQEDLTNQAIYSPCSRSPSSRKSCEPRMCTGSIRTVSSHLSRDRSVSC